MVPDVVAVPAAKGAANGGVRAPLLARDAEDDEDDGGFKVSRDGECISSTQAVLRVVSLLVVISLSIHFPPVVRSCGCRKGLFTLQQQQQQQRRRCATCFCVWGGSGGMAAQKAAVALSVVCTSRAELHYTPLRCIFVARPHSALVVGRLASLDGLPIQWPSCYYGTTPPKPKFERHHL